MPGQVGELLAQPPGRDALEAVDEPGRCDGRGNVDEQLDVLGLPLNSTSSQPKSSPTARMIASGVAGESSGGNVPGFSDAIASVIAENTEIASISGGSPTAFDR